MTIAHRVLKVKIKVMGQANVVGPTSRAVLSSIHLVLFSLHILICCWLSYRTKQAVDEQGSGPESHRSVCNVRPIFLLLRHC